MEEAIANRMVLRLSVPLPSPAKKRQHAVALPAQTATKAVLYLALREAKITPAELAKRLRCDEKEVQRLLDPRHPSKLSRVEAALAAMGQRLIVGLQSAA